MHAPRRSATHAAPTSTTTTSTLHTLPPHRQQCSPHAWRPRRASTRLHSTPDKLLMGALDKVLNEINARVVAEVERKNRKRLSGDTSKEAQPVGKSISFHAKAKADRLVKDPPQPVEGRSLGAYIRLPLSQYTVLDPRWISRAPSTNSSGTPDEFVLTVPLEELVSIDLKPSITIRVDVQDGQVQFSARDFKLGDPRFNNDDFQFELRAALRHDPCVNLEARLGGWVNGLTKAWGSSGGGARQLGQAPQPLQLPPPQVAQGQEQAQEQAQGQGGQEQGPGGVQPALQAGAGAEAEAGAAPASGQGEAGSSGGADGVAAQGAPSGPSAEGAAVGSSGAQGGAAGAGSPAQRGPPATGQGEGQGAAAPGPASPNDSGASINGSGGASASDRPDGGGDASATGRDAGLLACAVDVRVSMLVPPPLSVVPGPMLALAGSLVARASIKALLPAFLQLLSNDYVRWASGQQRSRTEAAGSLLSTVDDVTIKEGSEADSDVEAMMSEDEGDEGESSSGGDAASVGAAPNGTEKKDTAVANSV